MNSIFQLRDNSTMNLTSKLHTNPSNIKIVAKNIEMIHFMYKGIPTKLITTFFYTSKQFIDNKMISLTNLS